MRTFENPQSSRPQVVERRTIFEGRVVRLRVETLEFADGRRAELELIAHPGAAAIVPLTSSGEVLLLRQYRHVTAALNGGEPILEVPAGKLDPGETPEECARRECEEETGFRPNRLVPLGWIWMTPGFTDERIWLFLASELMPGEQKLEADEELTLERRPLREAAAAALGGEIQDAKSVVALLRAASYWESLSVAAESSTGSGSVA